MDIGLLAILYVFGALLLIAEIFTPSHGLLTVVGLTFLIWAVVKTFDVAGQTVGVFAAIASLAFVPTCAVIAVKVFHRTPLGRLISPPNPVTSPLDSSVPVEQLAALVGREGQSVSPLRPVGVCNFDGKRVSCVAQVGMIDANVPVQAIGVSGSNLTVVRKNA